MNKIKFDFGGWATKNDLKCTDGRVIRQNAFVENDGQKVPLVWQHGHSEPANVLGHAYLENRAEGVYAYCKLNDTERAVTTRELIKHGDVSALSIYANQLAQKGSDVIHGLIREVSIVLSPANPGAVIDNLSMAHANGSDYILDDEAIITIGIAPESPYLRHEEDEDDEEGETVGDILDGLSEEEKNVLYLLLAEAMDEDDDDDDDDEDYEDDDVDDDDEDFEHSDGGLNFMKHNSFYNTGEEVLEHNGMIRVPEEDVKALIHSAMDGGTKLSLAVNELMHAGTYGIDDIDWLFPDARTLQDRPEFYKRDTGWVKDVFNASRHSPFSRVKMIFADLTPDAARAKGYVTSAEKTDEVFGLIKRETSPKTIYKKQKLDRDDILDITSFDVVAWMKVEMRYMLDEEIARAMLIGDGRDTASADKISETNIRPIVSDADFYTHKVSLASDTTNEELLDAVVLNRQYWKGTGTPSLFASPTTIANLMVMRDLQGKRMFRTLADLAAEMRVSKIVEVEVMDGLTRVTDLGEVDEATHDVKFIIVNMQDYVLGADKGGEVNFFDDFDIDFNQEKYLIETRLSGSLVRPKAALVIEVTQAAG